MDASTRKPGRINWTNLITVGSACILIGTMTVGLSLATAWAITVTFGLGEIAEIVLSVIFVALAAFGLLAFWRSATRVEPVVER